MWCYLPSEVQHRDVSYVYMVEYLRAGIGFFGFSIFGRTAAYQWPYEAVFLKS